MTQTRRQLLSLPLSLSLSMLLSKPATDSFSLPISFLLLTQVAFKVPNFWSSPSKSHLAAGTDIRLTIGKATWKYSTQILLYLTTHVLCAFKHDEACMECFTGRCFYHGLCHTWLCPKSKLACTCISAAHWPCPNYFSQLLTSPFSWWYGSWWSGDCKSPGQSLHHLYTLHSTEKQHTVLNKYKRGYTVISSYFMDPMLVEDLGQKWSHK